MGTGSSSPKSNDGGVVGVEGGAVFQQRPAHCRLEGRSEMEGGEEFTDISYSDLGFIITPQTKKLIINNNNYQSSLEESTSPNPSQSSSSAPPSPTSMATYLDHDCDFVSSEVDSGNVGLSGTSSSSSNSSNNNSSSSLSGGVTLQHRTSNSSFTMSQLPGATRHDPPSPKNLDDLRLEEISS